MSRRCWTQTRGTGGKTWNYPLEISSPLSEELDHVLHQVMLYWAYQLTKTNQAWRIITH